MSILSFLLITVVVGLTNNTLVTLTDAQFNGFLQTRDDGKVVLTYRQGKIRGELLADAIARIDFGYEIGQPFPLRVTLKNGQKLEVQSEHGNFVQLRGKTDSGAIVISHPDPVAPPTQIRTRSANRKDDLTIQFLEFGP